LVRFDVRPYYYVTSFIFFITIFRKERQFRFSPILGGFFSLVFVSFLFQSKNGTDGEHSFRFLFFSIQFLAMSPLLVSTRSNYIRTQVIRFIDDALLGVMALSWLLLFAGQNLLLIDHRGNYSLLFHNSIILSGISGYLFIKNLDFISKKWPYKIALALLLISCVIGSSKSALFGIVLATLGTGSISFVTKLRIITIAILGLSLLIFLPEYFKLFNNKVDVQILSYDLFQTRESKWSELIRDIKKFGLIGRGLFLVPEETGSSFLALAARSGLGSLLALIIYLYRNIHKKGSVISLYFVALLFSEGFILGPGSIFFSLFWLNSESSA